MFKLFVNLKSQAKNYKMGKKILITLLFALLSTSANLEKVYVVKNVAEEENVNWNKLIYSIIQVESSGNEKAISKDGTCVGAMQIKKIVVDDCNEYLEMKGVDRRYEYDDRYSIKKSIEMFNLIQERYNKELDLLEAIRIWNGGCNWRNGKHDTRPYVAKVLKLYNKTNKKMGTI